MLKMLNIARRFALTLVLICGVLLWGGDAFACGDLLLASQGTDFGKLSCDANGFVVLDPTSKSDLIGFEIKSQKVTGKSGGAGTSFALDKNKGKVQVIEKVTGNDRLNFRCSPGKNGNGILSLPNSLAGSKNFLVSKINGPSKEMEYDTIELCATSPIAQKRYNVFSSQTIIDLDNDLLLNGHTTSVLLGGKDWAKPVKASVYFAKDDSSADRDFVIQFYDPNLPTTSSAIEATTLYKVKSTVPAFSATNYEITLDYRYDPTGKINPRLKGLLEGVVNEFKGLIKENSKSNYSGPNISLERFGLTPALSGIVKTQFASSHPNPVHAIIDGYEDTSLATIPNKKVVTASVNEFFDDMTIYVGPITFLDSITGATIPSFNLLLNAYASERPIGQSAPAFYNKNNSTPFMSLVGLNVDTLALFSDEYVRAVLRHEMIHVFGGVNITPYPIGSSNPTKVNAAGKYAGVKVLAQNGQNPIEMETGPDAVHFNDNVPTTVDTLMRKTGIFPTTVVSQIDKAIMADNGFCVTGINDTPSCN